TTQVTLLVQNHATILNEFDLAYLLAEGIHPRLLRAAGEHTHPNPCPRHYTRHAVSSMPVAIVDLDKLPVLDQVTSTISLPSSLPMLSVLTCFRAGSFDVEHGDLGRHARSRLRQRALPAAGRRDRGAVRW